MTRPPRRSCFPHPRPRCSSNGSWAESNAIPYHAEGGSIWTIVPKSSTVSSPRRKGGRSSGALPICWTKSRTQPGPAKGIPPGGNPVLPSLPTMPIRGRLSRPAPSKAARTRAKGGTTALTFPPFWALLRRDKASPPASPIKAGRTCPRCSVLLPREEGNSLASPTRTGRICPPF